MRVGHSAVSGMQAHEMMFAAGSNNIANVNTPGYRAQQVDLAADPNGGVKAAGVSDRRSGELPDGAADVSLAEEIPRQIVAELGYTANAQMVRSADELTGSLIDVRV